MARWKTKHFLAGYQPGDKAVFDIDLGASQRVAVLAWMGTDIGLGRAKMYFVGEEDSFVYIFGDNPPGQNLGNRSVYVSPFWAGVFRGLYVTDIFFFFFFYDPQSHQSRFKTPPGSSSTCRGDN